MCIATNYIQEIKLLTDKYEKCMLELNEKRSNIDMQLQDLIHAIEARKELKLPANVLMKLLVKQSQLRNQRREICNDIFLMSNLQPVFDSIKDKLKVRDIENKIELAIKRQAKPNYKPRTNVLLEFNIDFEQQFNQ